MNDSLGFTLKPVSNSHYGEFATSQRDFKETNEWAEFGAALNVKP